MKAMPVAKPFAQYLTSLLLLSVSPTLASNVAPHGDTHREANAYTQLRSPYEIQTFYLLGERGLLRLQVAGSGQGLGLRLAEGDSISLTVDRAIEPEPDNSDAQTRGTVYEHIDGKAGTVYEHIDGKAGTVYEHIDGKAGTVYEHIDGKAGTVYEHIDTGLAAGLHWEEVGTMRRSHLGNRVLTRYQSGVDSLEVVVPLVGGPRGSEVITLLLNDRPLDLNLQHRVVSEAGRAPENDLARTLASHWESFAPAPDFHKAYWTLNRTMLRLAELEHGGSLAPFKNSCWGECSTSALSLTTYELSMPLLQSACAVDRGLGCLGVIVTNELESVQAMMTGGRCLSCLNSSSR